MIEDYRRLIAEEGSDALKLYPTFNLFEGDDTSLFMEECVFYYTEENLKMDMLKWWSFIGHMFHTSAESFLHTCGVIAQTEGVKLPLVQAAMWILYLIRNLQTTCGGDMYTYRAMFGLSDEAYDCVENVDEFGHRTSHIKNIVKLAKALDS